MKKLLIGAAIVAAFTASAAQAAITLGGANNRLPTITPADTDVIYISGASAAEKFLEKVFTNAAVPAADKICDSSKAIYKFQDTTGKLQYAYLCEKATTNTSVPTTKPNLLIYKRSEGGSAFGVSPIVAEANNNTAAATIHFLQVNSTNCTEPASIAAAGSLTTISCTYDAATKFVDHVSDAGISDVDPGQFVGENAPLNTDTGLPYANVKSTDLPKLKISATATVAFGVPVTKNLYFALQAAQIASGNLASACSNVAGVFNETEACMPSLSSAQVADIHAGNIVNWDQFKVNGTGLAVFVSTNADSAISALAPGSNVLHTCRRENGSGTQAQSNSVFLNYPCSTAATIPAKDSVVLGFAEADGAAMIHENSASGNVDDCLNDLQDGANTANTFNNTYLPGSRWAVGIQSLEKSTASATKYRFVKVDGVSPTLANVVSGKYKDWAENTFQYANNHVWASADTKSIADAIIKSAGLPEVMAALNTGFTHTFTSAKGAYLAVPSNYAIEANGVFTSTRPVNAYSHATADASANACRAPVVYSADSVL